VAPEESPRLDDEGELADLGEAHPGLDRGAYSVSARNVPNVTPRPAGHDQDQEHDDGTQCRPTRKDRSAFPPRRRTTAAKASQSGFTSPRLLFQADSATSAPARKAPRATEYPNARASRAQAKQIPTHANERRFGAFRREDGTDQAGNGQHSDEPGGRPETRRGALPSRRVRGRTRRIRRRRP